MIRLDLARRALARGWRPRPAGPVLTWLACAAAAALFTIAGLVAGFVLVLLCLGFTDLGLGWLYAALVIVPSVALGLWCLPVRPPPRHRPPRSGGRHRHIRPSGEADVEMLDPAGRADLNEQLERLYRSEAFRPPHDYQVRPSVPPDRAGGDHG